MSKKHESSKKLKRGKKTHRGAALSAMPPYDEHAAYSCEDDPFQGRKDPVDVELLALDLQACDRCQGTDKRVEAAVERCRGVLSALGYDIRLSITVITNEWMAEQYRFYSSPTIRVNGVDICPSIEENDCDCCRDICDADVKCRLYPFNGTYYEVPPTDMIIQGIMETVLSDRHADPAREPYELPQNFADFFAGVRRKQAAGGTPAEGDEGACCCAPGCC